MQIFDFEDDGFCFVNYVNLPISKHYIIWETRNLQEIRKFMENPEPFCFEKHLEFVKLLSRVNDRFYWAVFKGDKFIMSINLHPICWIKDCAEWGIYANPLYAQRGISRKISNIFFKHVKRTTSLNKINAKVKKENINSVRFHKNLDFLLTEQDELFFYFEKML
ncbi:GNAT family N-acetyltransferase [Tannerella forsythia]|nr:GNAT family N-acetyltransferase [Tannerella forsythia]